MMTLDSPHSKRHGTIKSSRTPAPNLAQTTTLQTVGAACRCSEASLHRASPDRRPIAYVSACAHGSPPHPKTRIVMTCTGVPAASGRLPPKMLVAIIRSQGQ